MSRHCSAHGEGTVKRKSRNDFVRALCECPHAGDARVGSPWHMRLFSMCEAPVEEWDLKLEGKAEGPAFRYHERPCVSMLRFNPKNNKEPPENFRRRAVRFEEITVAGVELDAGNGRSKETAKGNRCPTVLGTGRVNTAWYLNPGLSSATLIRLPRRELGD